MTLAIVIPEHAKKHEITEAAQIWSVPVDTGRMRFHIEIDDDELKPLARTVNYVRQDGTLSLQFAAAVSGTVYVWEVARGEKVKQRVG